MTNKLIEKLTRECKIARNLLIKHLQSLPEEKIPGEYLEESTGECIYALEEVIKEAERYLKYEVKE